MDEKKILIVGAGISGLFMARALEKELGIRPKIIEKFPQLRIEGAGIGLPGNGVDCLEYLGLKENLIEVAYQIKSYTDALPTDEIIRVTSVTEPPLDKHLFVMLSRERLIKLLAENLRSKIEFNQDTVDISSFDLVIAADGVHSSLRISLVPEELRKDVGFLIWRFITHYQQENPILYSGNQSAFSIFPIGKDEVYCYAHVANNNAKEYLLEAFREYPPQVDKLIRSVPLDNIIFGKQTILTKPVLTHKNVVFIGDASHACTPFLQQGAAAAWEDAIALAKMLSAFPTLQMAIKHYENFRSKRIHWIHDTSNNPEKYGDKAHALKKIEGWKELLSQSYFELLEAYLRKYD